MTNTIIFGCCPVATHGYLASIPNTLGNNLVLISRDDGRVIPLQPATNFVTASLSTKMKQMARDDQ
jgi:hypothetical protein